MLAAIEHKQRPSTLKKCEEDGKGVRALNEQAQDGRQGTGDKRPVIDRAEVYEPYGSVEA